MSFWAWDCQYPISTYQFISVKCPHLSRKSTDYAPRETFNFPPLSRTDACAHCSSSGPLIDLSIEIAFDWHFSYNDWIDLITSFAIWNHIWLDRFNNAWWDWMCICNFAHLCSVLCVQQAQYSILEFEIETFLSLSLSFYQTSFFWSMIVAYSDSHPTLHDGTG